MHSYVDVLIVGAGPSGLMLATWLARLGVKTRVVDKRFSSINSGQADGLQSRTFEIFDSLGFGQDIWREANHMLEIRFWNPNESNILHRSGCIVDTKPGLSRFQQATLRQARIEEYLVQYVQKFSDIRVERGVMPELLSVDVQAAKDRGSYPVSVTLRHLPPEPIENQNHESSAVLNGLYRSNLTADTTSSVLEAAKGTDQSWTEEVCAKYIVGCDGAHSWTRKQIGSIMEGDQTDHIWGVLDIIPITDFPDIRYRCAIHSVSGSMMVIPRENQYVRLYIQVTELAEQGKLVDKHNINPENLLSAANKILHPYKLSYKHCHWWTAYRIGQRVATKFSAYERVFLAGDAVHTHSPKAGQGMNISMHDAYNLGWKLAYVIKGWANTNLLESYSMERRQIAQELIEFDHRFSRVFSARPAMRTADKDGVDPQTFRAIFEKGNLFASGCAVDYEPNPIVIKSHSDDQKIEIPATCGSEDGNAITSKQHLAKGILIGMRIPSHQVLNQSDARPWHLQELLPSTGSWRVLVFAGNILDPKQWMRYQTLGKVLGSPESFLQKYNTIAFPDTAGLAIIEVLTIHSAPRKSVELLSIPDVFHPFSHEYGWDYNKVFVDDESYHKGHGRAYQNYGIDSQTGCLVVVRPDQYVSWIGDLEDVHDIDRFFVSILSQTPCA